MPQKSIRVLHVALEGGPAIFGGLGRVATQMLEAQSQLRGDLELSSGIIMPFYPPLLSTFTERQLISEVEHLYDHKVIKSKIFLATHRGCKYYLLEPAPEYKHLFAITSRPEIYADTEHSNFIDRVKFFNSAVAAYVNNPNLGIEHPAPEILHLHDWQAAIVPKLLKENYNNTKIKSVFMVHIDSGDRGTFSTESLQGIGLQFNKKNCILKAIGLLHADKIVAVSPKFLRECIETPGAEPELEYLRKIFAWSSAQHKTAGIANGIDYAFFNPVGKQILDPNNIYAEKFRLKCELAKTLSGSRLVWRIDPNLPLILYVGRYSPEKGSDVFAQVIADTKGKANFIAVGRGMTEDVFHIIVHHSRQTDNVFVTASEKEQAELLEKLRAAADIILVPSHRDAFGLVAAEGVANGCVVVTTGVGGLKDIAIPLQLNNPEHTTGNGIFYEDMPDGSYNPSLTSALNQALGIWAKLTPQQINKMQQRIINDAAKFDWLAANGSIDQHNQVYVQLVSPTTSHEPISQAYKINSKRVSTK